MPKLFFYETAITINHEDNEMLVDTTQTGIARQLLRCGFVETTKPSARIYRRFQGQADQIRFRKLKGQRRSATGSVMPHDVLAKPRTGGRQVS